MQGWKTKESEHCDEEKLKKENGEIENINDGTQKRRKQQNTETVATAERRVSGIQYSARKSEG